MSNIAIDIDNTLFDMTVVEDVLKEMGCDEAVNDWEFGGLPDRVVDECYRRFDDPAFMCFGKPVDGAIQKLVMWQEQGHSLYAITARSLVIKEQTIEMVHRFFPDIPVVFSNDFYSGYSSVKGKAYFAYNIDVVIDDSPKVLAEIQNDKSINKFLISNLRTRYNHDYANKIKVLGLDICVCESIVDVCF